MKLRNRFLNQAVWTFLISSILFFSSSNTCFGQFTTNDINIIGDSAFLKSTNSLFTGVHEEYFADSLIKLEFTYKSGLKISTTITHYSSIGIKKEEGCLDKNSKRQGKWILSYYPDNLPRYYTFYTEGISDGSFHYLDKTGNEIPINITEQDYRNLLEWLVDSNIISDKKRFTIINKFFDESYEYSIFFSDNDIPLMWKIDLPDSTLEIMYC